MSKITLDTGIDKIKDPGDQIRFISQLFDQIKTLLNGGLTFSDNSNLKLVSYTFATADTTFGIPHGLGRQPVGYLAIHVTAAMIIYGGTTPWNATNIYLQSSAVGTADLLVF